jgi:hypothetical protein
MDDRDDKACLQLGLDNPIKNFKRNAGMGIRREGKSLVM